MCCSDQLNPPRKADVRGAILVSAAEGKTIAAKRGSRGALELWPTIEQGTNWNPSRELLWPSGGAMQLENHQLLLQPGFLTRFFHVEFTKGVYCRRIDYGQCGI
jgi:hypothetical protein